MRNPCKDCIYYHKENKTCQSKKCATGGSGKVSWVDRLFCSPCKKNRGDSNEVNKCVAGGYHEWMLSAIGSDGIGNRVDTYQCRKCGETFKIKLEES